MEDMPAISFRDFCSELGNAERERSITIFRPSGHDGCCCRPDVTRNDFLPRLHGARRRLSEDATAAYRSTAFKAALGRDRLMCLFGVLSC